ncbi:MAG: histidine phosphatase family protein [Pseudomonadota bacterium]
MKLWLIRHAPVDAAPGLCYGASDLPAQADETQRAAIAMASQLPNGIALQSSPLRRCTALAQAIGALRPDLEHPRLDPRLAEMDFGAWELQPWQQIPRADIDAWTADFADQRAGITGESTRSFMQRVGAAWDAWRATGRDAAWFTHAGVIRAVWLLQRGVRCPRDAAEWPVQPIAHGEWLSVEAD